jgi:hypothetical protein
MVFFLFKYLAVSVAYVSCFVGIVSRINFSKPTRLFVLIIILLYQYVFFQAIFLNLNKKRKLCRLWKRRVTGFPVSYITRYAWDLLAYHLQNIIFTLSVRNVYYLVVLGPKERQCTNVHAILRLQLEISFFAKW